MGSLKKIMNVDDDQHRDPQDIRRETRSASISSQEHESSPSPSSSSSSSPSSSSSSSSPSSSPSSFNSSSLAMPRYSVGIDYPTIQNPSRRPSLPYSLHSSPLALGYPSPTGSRRRSNTSTGSMESSFGRSHNHANAYSAASLRSAASGVVGGEHPVKLTPITGRVSRAKKGVPVHTCELCRPTKTFTRAEHLRRHQLSHQPPELACAVPGCDKVFHRKDLLERHQQRHEQEENSAKEAASQASRRSFATTSPSQGYGASPPISIPIQSLQIMQPPFVGSPHHAGISSSSMPEMSMSAGHWPSALERSSRRGHRREPQSAYQLDVKAEYVIDSVPCVHESNPRIIPGFDEPRTSLAMASVLSAVPDVGMPDPASSSIPWPEAIPSSASESAYSTPSSDQQGPSRTPSMEWTGQISSFAAASSPIIANGGYPLPFGYDTTPPQGYAAVYGDAMSFSLPEYEDRTPMYGSHDALATATATDRDMMYSRSLSREPVDALGLFVSQDVMSMNLTRETRSAIPTYLEVYWDKAHPMHPIIHRPTFENASDMAPEHLDILQCAMAAVATQFLEHGEHRNNGHQLHAYSWEKSKMYTNSQEWPLPIMQSILLCEYYARFRGRSKKSHQPSIRFETLYQMVINMQTSNYALHLSACSHSQQWSFWVDLESRRRLLSACFLLDVHTMIYLEQPRVGTLGLNYDSPETLPIPLSVSTSRLWDARTCQAWSSLNYAGIIPTTIGSTLLGGFSAADMASLPAFDAALLQAAYALRLPPRRTPSEPEFLEDVSSIRISDYDLANLFPCSPSAMTYLALHHTPLYTLLSVSGDSWVFNKKILRAQDFATHQVQLRSWRDSGSAAVAVIFAARALGLFLNANAQTYSSTGSGRSARRKEMSDFWGMYACALICWAFGHAGTRRGRTSVSVGSRSRGVALRWIAEVADMAPGAVGEMSEAERRDGLGVVGLARGYLERECLGGRNMLLADALGVLKKLEEGDGYRYF